MNTLFPLEPDLPPGFIYYPDFLSKEEESTLISTCEKLELHNLIFQGFEAKRRVESYGYNYNFDKRSITKGLAIPSELEFVIDKAAQKLAMEKEEFEQVLVTEYPVGSVINWHRDAPPFDIIAGISLLSDCTFRLRPYDKSKQGRGAIRSLTVKRGSLYIMQGESRSEWEHSIAPVKKMRYSITLRSLR